MADAILIGGHSVDIRNTKGVRGRGGRRDPDRWTPRSVRGHAEPNHVAVADAILIGGHPFTAFPPRNTLTVAVADAILIGGHVTMPADSTDLDGRGGRRDPDRWTHDLSLHTRAHSVVAVADAILIGGHTSPGRDPASTIVAVADAILIGGHGDLDCCEQADAQVAVADAILIGGHLIRHGVSCSALMSRWPTRS